MSLDIEDFIIVRWPARGVVHDNWGDRINPYLVGAISGRPVLNDRDAGPTASPVYQVIGSGLRSVDRSTIVWGSGFISQADRIRFRPKSVLAVRGPATRNKLIKLGVRCPRTYGDPALLFPAFYAGSRDVKYELGVIRHVREQDISVDFRGIDPDRVKLIDICGSISGVIDDVLSCERIVSSSLHGLIVAHAYGVPAGWIKLSDRLLGDGFKFNDYWLSIGVSGAAPIIVEPGMNVSRLSGPEGATVSCRVDLARLVRSCPFATEERKAQLLKLLAERSGFVEAAGAGMPERARSDGDDAVTGVDD